MKKLNLKTETTANGEVLSRTQLKKVLGGVNKSTICNDWGSNPETCYNCCITVNSWDYCATKCGH